MNSWKGNNKVFIVNDDDGNIKIYEYDTQLH